MRWAQTVRFNIANDKRVETDGIVASEDGAIEFGSNIMKFSDIFKAHNFAVSLTNQTGTDGSTAR